MVWRGRSHGGKGIGCCVDTLTGGDQPLSKGEGEVGGMTCVSETVKKFLALDTEPHLEQLI